MEEHIGFVELSTWKRLVDVSLRKLVAANIQLQIEELLTGIIFMAKPSNLSRKVLAVPEASGFQQQSTTNQLKDVNGMKSVAAKYHNTILELHLMSISTVKPFLLLRETSVAPEDGGSLELSLTKVPEDVLDTAFTESCTKTSKLN